jgi:hypothetical protein
MCKYHDQEFKDGSMRLTLTLAKNAVQLVEFIPVEDHSDDYYSLDKDFYRNLSV